MSEHRFRKFINVIGIKDLEFEFKGVDYSKLSEYFYKLKKPERYLGQIEEDNLIKINKNINRYFVENLDDSNEVTYWSINCFKDEIATDIYAINIKNNKIEEKLFTFVPYFSSLIKYNFLSDEQLLTFKTEEMVAYWTDFWTIDRVFKKLDSIQSYSNNHKIQHFIYDEKTQKLYNYQLREKLH